MRGPLTILTAIVLLSTVAAPTVAPGAVDPAGDSGPAAGADPAGNGIVTMVHLSFEPWVPGPPPVAEALAGTNDGMFVYFHAIPYDVTGQKPLPTVLSEPEIEILDPAGEVLVRSGPNLDPASRPTCVEETSLENHTGPVEACVPLAVPASTFNGHPVVQVKLHWTNATGPQVENYNIPAHLLLHSAIEGTPVDLDTVDQHLTQATPVVVEYLVDPVP